MRDAGPAVEAAMTKSSARRGSMIVKAGGDDDHESTMYQTHNSVDVQVQLQGSANGSSESNVSNFFTLHNVCLASVQSVGGHR